MHRIINTWRMSHGNLMETRRYWRQRQHHFFISQICTEQLLCSRFYCRNWRFKRKAGQTTTQASCSRCSSKWGSCRTCAMWQDCSKQLRHPDISFSKQISEAGPFEPHWVLLAGQRHPWWLGLLLHPAPSLDRPAALQLEPPPPPGSSWSCPQGSSPITAPSLCITHANPVPREGAPCWLCSQAHLLGAEI